jgi:hypothetical protein
MKKSVKKVCRHHGVTDFVEEKSGRLRCKKCRSEAVQRRRDIIKIQAVEYKGGKCEKCGYNKCIGALEFHHKDPNAKDFGIASKGYTRSWEKVKKELDKCILVCSNCHREIHEADKEQKLSLHSKEKKRKSLEKRFCEACNTLFKPSHSKTKYCSINCSSKSKEKIDWPSHEKLQEMVNNSNYSAVGRKLGVSDNAVRKRLNNKNE